MLPMLLFEPAEGKKENVEKLYTFGLICKERRSNMVKSKGGNIHSGTEVPIG